MKINDYLELETVSKFESGGYNKNPTPPLHDLHSHLAKRVHSGESRTDRQRHALHHSHIHGRTILQTNTSNCQHTSINGSKSYLAKLVKEKFAYLHQHTYQKALTQWQMYFRFQCLQIMPPAMA